MPRLVQRLQEAVFLAFFRCHYQNLQNHRTLEVIRNKNLKIAFFHQTIDFELAPTDLSNETNQNLQFPFHSKVIRKLLKNSQNSNVSEKRVVPNYQKYRSQVLIAHIEDRILHL